MLAYVMLTGHSPFAGDSRQETLLNISQVNLDFPEDLFSVVSKSAIDFISRLLVKQPRSVSFVKCLTNRSVVLHVTLVLDKSLNVKNSSSTN